MANGWYLRTLILHMYTWKMTNVHRTSISKDNFIQLYNLYKITLGSQLQTFPMFSNTKINICNICLCKIILKYLPCFDIECYIVIHDILHVSYVKYNVNDNVTNAGCKGR